MSATATGTRCRLAHTDRNTHTRNRTHSNTHTPPVHAHTQTHTSKLCDCLCIFVTQKKNEKTMRKRIEFGIVNALLSLTPPRPLPQPPYAQPLVFPFPGNASCFCSWNCIEIHNTSDA